MSKKEIVIKRLRELLTADQIRLAEEKAKMILSEDKARSQKAMADLRAVQELRKKMGLGPKP